MLTIVKVLILLKLFDSLCSYIYVYLLYMYVILKMICVTKEINEYTYIIYMLTNTNQV